MDIAMDTIHFQVKPTIIDTIMRDLFLRNNETQDNVEEEDKDEDGVEKEDENGVEAVAITKNVTKKAKEQTNTMTLFIKITRPTCIWSQWKI